MSARKLTDKQVDILLYLAACGHATRNTMRANFKWNVIGTLKSLAKLGLVELMAYSRTPMSNNTRWVITDEGRREATEQRVLESYREGVAFGLNWALDHCDLESYDIKTIEEKLR